ncbi:MAG: OmpA family protein [Opitutae bacterium]|nr:OmpA family protein [Opitutae bacterium]
MKKALTIVCLLVIVALLAWKWTETGREEKKREELLLQSSDAVDFDRVITVWGDDWLGYLIFKSRAMQEYLKEKNLGIRYENVFDFEERVAGLNSGKCDLATITIDSYLTNGQGAGYPGAIVFLIDESYGGDAIVGGPKVNTLDDLDEKGIRGSLVGFSPSEFLLKSSISHFKLENAKTKVASFRAENSAEAFSRFKEGNADFAVLWEPFVSQAVDQILGAKVVLDTTQARGVILDVAVASRKTLVKEPEVIKELTKAYFRALHYYLNRPAEFEALAAAYSGESSGVAAGMLAGIRFITLKENAEEWFGLQSGALSKLVEGIERIHKICRDVGDLSSPPVGGSFYGLVNSDPIKASASAKEVEAVHRYATKGYVSGYFPPFSQEQWNGVKGRITGTFIDEPVIFGSGQAVLSEEFRDKLRAASGKLAHYPNHRIVIQANVSPGTDSAVDLALSGERALAIKGYLVGVCSVNENRILAEGLGSTNLPQQYPGESSRAWKRRCRLAKIFLVHDAKANSAGVTP